MTTNPSDYDGDGLDSSWDAIGEHDIPDLSGLQQQHFEAAAADLGIGAPEPGNPPGAGAGDVARADAPKLGSGKRFANLKASLAAKGAHDPGALAAYIGRKKFGKAKFQKLAAHARSKSSDGSRADSAAFDGFLVRSFPLEDIHVLRSGDGRTVEAYAAVFDSETDIRDPQGRYREVIDRSAFNRAIDKARPQGSRNYWLTRCFYNHGMTIHGTPSERFSVPLGVTHDIRVESRGLLTVTRYNQTPLAEEILENIRNGAITGHSFTGRIVRSDPQLGPGQLYRGQTVRRLELGLSEYGPTPIPFYADAEIVGVRAALAYTGTAEPVSDEGPLPEDGSLAGEAEPEAPAEEAPVEGHVALSRRMAAYAAAHGLDLTPRD